MTSASVRNSGPIILRAYGVFFRGGCLHWPWPRKISSAWFCGFIFSILYYLKGNWKNKSIEGIQLFFEDVLMTKYDATKYNLKKKLISILKNKSNREEFKTNLQKIVDYISRVSLSYIS